jgi:hypothetical protein
LLINFPIEIFHLFQVLQMQFQQPIDLLEITEI